MKKDRATHQCEVSSASATVTSIPPSATVQMDSMQPAGSSSNQGNDQPQQMPVAVGTLMTEQQNKAQDIESLRQEMKDIADTRPAYLVKFLAFKIFTREELINCSISGKRSVTSKETRPPLSQDKFRLLKQLIAEKMPALGHNEIREKFQNVQKVLRKSAIQN